MISAYTNPTSDLLNIELQSDRQTELFLKLFDLQGRCLYVEKIEQNQISKQLNLAQFNNNFYLLKITSINGKLLKTFKIQKVN